MTHYLRALAAKLRGLFGDRRADQELDGEIETHLRLLTERYVRQGMTEAEAEWAARRQFGNITSLKEANREMRGIRFIDTFFQDLRYGLTMLRRNPGFTIVAVLTLALGTGAITAIFSVVNAVVLRPLPYRDPDRLVLVPNASGHDFLRWRDQSKAFESMAAFYFGTADFTGSGEPERVAVATVSTELFATLGVAPALGRAFTPEEDRVGGEPVVVLSDSLWRRRFGIGANTAIFSMLEGVVLAPLPYRDAERLVAVLQSRPGVPRGTPSGPDFQEWRRNARSFEQTSGISWGGRVLSNPGTPEHLDGREISSGFFSTLGINLRLGREFSPQEDRRGENPVAIISNRLWQDRFGGSREALGRTVTLDGVDHTIVGVLPSGFKFGWGGGKRRMFIRPLGRIIFRR